MSAFLAEATKMQSIQHKHLLAPLGVTEKRDLPLVVYPEANLLDLKTYIVDPHHVRILSWNKDSKVLIVLTASVNEYSQWHEQWV